jgi:hypothetical protein
MIIVLIFYVVCSSESDYYRVEGRLLSYERPAKFNTCDIYPKFRSLGAKVNACLNFASLSCDN